MTLSEVAAYLRISQPLAYQMVQRGALPAFKMGRLWRFHRADLEKFLVHGQIITHPRNIPHTSRVFHNEIMAYYRITLMHKLTATRRGGWITMSINEYNWEKDPKVRIYFRNVRLSNNEKAISISERSWRRVPDEQKPRWQRLMIK